MLSEFAMKELAIYLGVTEVTQAEYEKVMGANPSSFAPQGLGKAAAEGMDTSLHPVELVTCNRSHRSIIRRYPACDSRRRVGR